MPKLILRDAHSEREIDAASGLSLMEILREAGVSTIGECNGSLACATCHVVIERDWYDRLPPSSEAEEDMLDSAFNLAPTSRLACQIRMSGEYDGLVVRLPET